MTVAEQMKKRNYNKFNNNLKLKKMKTAQYRIHLSINLSLSDFHLFYCFVYFVKLYIFYIVVPLSTKIIFTFILIFDCWYALTQSSSTFFHSWYLNDLAN